jgi:RNA polymerase sigma-70 factor (ECF subfamily)
MQEDKQKVGREDFDLLADFNSGSEAAFTLIVKKHSGPLINFLYRYTRDRSASEDIAQEAFLRLYKAAPGLKPGAKLSTILFKFAYNLAVDQARKNKSRSARAPVSSLDAAPYGREPASGSADTPDGRYEAGERAAEINSSLAELPETQRLALLLKIYDDRSYAEIGEIMGLSVPSVESLLFRARQSLARKLK